MIPRILTTTRVQIAIRNNMTGQWHGRYKCVECNVCITKRHKCKEPGQSLFEALENAQKNFDPSYRRQSWENYKKYGLRKRS